MKGTLSSPSDCCSFLPTSKGKRDELSKCSGVPWSEDEPNMRAIELWKVRFEWNRAVARALHVNMSCVLRVSFLFSLLVSS